MANFDLMYLHEFSRRQRPSKLSPAFMKGIILSIIEGHRIRPELPGTGEKPRSRFRD